MGVFGFIRVCFLLSFWHLPGIKEEIHRLLAENGDKKVFSRIFG